MRRNSIVDGLRTVAILLVLLFHLDIEFFRQGFIGVDIFFVISGFLMAKVTEKDFSFTIFIKKRIYRIFPTYFVIVLISLISFSLILSPGDLKSLWAQIPAAIFFYTNIYFANNINYFNENLITSPFLHLWSLGVEVQFYIFFGLLMAMTKKIILKKKIVLFFLLIILSLLVSELLKNYNENYSFYLFFSRLWEFLAGSLAFYLKNNLKSSSFLSIMGLMLLGLGLLVIEDSNFPGLGALLPVMGTVLLIRYPSRAIHLAIGNNLIGAIGKKSYSIYLVHWPVIVFLRIAADKISLISTLFLIVLFSLLAYYFIEKRQDIHIILFVTLPLSLLIFLNSNQLIERAIQKKYDVTIDKNVSYELVLLDPQPKDINFFESELGKSNCRFLANTLDVETSKKLRQCEQLFGSGVLILGDSHAIDLYGSVLSRFKDPFVVGLASGGCRPVPQGDCYYDDLLNFISKHPTIIKHIIYEQAGFYLLLNPEGYEMKRTDINSFNLTDPIENFTINENKIILTVDYLKQLSNHVPTTWFLPRIEPFINKEFVLTYGCDFDYQFRPNQKNLYQNLDKEISVGIKKNPKEGLAYRSQISLYEFQFPRDFMNCKEIFWNDGDHYSAAGEKFFGYRIPNDFLVHQNR